MNCSAEAPLPPRVPRDIPDETVKALVDCLVIIILLATATTTVIDIVRVLRWFSQVSRLRQRRQVHVPLFSPSLRSCSTSGASRS